MNAAAPAAAPFSRASALALVVLGAALFVALIYLIGEGENIEPPQADGGAHAVGTGLNGYAGLVRLLEQSDYGVERSRTETGLETQGLLVLTPPPSTDPDELGEILRRRQTIGPTLVILPKWEAISPPPVLPQEVTSRFKPGWVMFNGAFGVMWTNALPAPYAFRHQLLEVAESAEPGWTGLGLSGRLPTRTMAFLDKAERFAPLITDPIGRPLAARVETEAVSALGGEAHQTIFLAEPDLANNYGLADPRRAAAALALIDAAAYDGKITQVTFDLTLNGFGGTMNLLTLAFRPPFLAVTLCLLLALAVVGWRAFQRFGPAAQSAGPAIAFGKGQLIVNGAGLILRARRTHLLAAPYAALAARRLAHRLGLTRADAAEIDAALARRLPGEEPFSARAARLEAARRPADIVRAARALDELSRKATP